MLGMEGCIEGLREKSKKVKRYIGRGRASFFTSHYLGAFVLIFLVVRLHWHV